MFLISRKDIRVLKKDTLEEILNLQFDYIVFSKKINQDDILFIIYKSNEEVLMTFSLSNLDIDHLSKLKASKQNITESIEMTETGRVTKTDIIPSKSNNFRLTTKFDSKTK